MSVLDLFCSRHFPCNKCERHYYKGECTLATVATVGSQIPLDEESARAIAFDASWYSQHGSESLLRDLYNAFPAIKPPPKEQGHYISRNGRWYLSREQSDWVLLHAAVPDFYKISLDTSNSLFVVTSGKETSIELDNRAMFPCWTYADLHNWYHLSKEAEENSTVLYSRNELVSAILAHGITESQMEHGALPEMTKAAATYAFVQCVDMQTPAAKVIRAALVDLSEKGQFNFKD